MKKLLMFVSLLILVTIFSKSVNAQTVEKFSIRIADFMPFRDTWPNMDDPASIQRFENALTDLENASKGGEISHVQLRLYWYVDAGNSSTWNYPVLGSNDSSQKDIMDNWRKWYFGEGAPSSYQTAVERIKAHGFKVEIGISVSWNPTIRTTNNPPPLRRYATEADYPEFNGQLFAQNYFNNVLNPVAQLATGSGMIQSGDIFLIGFENYDPSCDHPRLHSSIYSNSISQLRTILPYGVHITEDVQGWYEDRILGVNYPNGVLKIPYLGDLDFLSFSMWIPWLSTFNLPATRQKIRDAHFNNTRFAKTGIPSTNGRDFMYDNQLIYDTFHKPILWNSGLRNCYSATTFSNPEIGCTPSPEGVQEQAEFWTGRLMALSNQTWAAGQDFERYNEPTTYTSATTSWRNRPAQDAIMSGIRDILGLNSNKVSIQGRLTDESNNPIQTNIFVYQSGTNVVVNSTQADDGNYELSVLPSIYDIQYSLTNFFIQNFFIRLNSINVASDESDLINYIKNIGNQNFSFIADIYNDQLIQTYSPQRPERVLINGTPISEVSSYSHLTDNTWFYDSSTDRLYVSSSATGGGCSCSAWTNQNCNLGGCTNQQYQTRTCTPSGCDITSRCIPDASCMATCPDSVCAVSENCPADANFCSEPSACYSRTCINGYNNPASAIASGLQDTEGSNRCDNTVGCSTPPCQCDGLGVCISVPSSIQITNCDNTNGWSFTCAGNSINTEDKQEGSGSLNITKNSSCWWAYDLYNPSGTWNWSPYQAIKFKVKTSDASRESRIYVMTDWSNYNYYRFDSQLSTNNWVEVILNLNNPTSSTGTVDFSEIDMIRFELGNSYANADWLVDDIRIL